MMKLLKRSGCLFSERRGNVKEQTTLVEGQGIFLRTRVRLSSSPLKLNKSNSVYDIIVYRNMFCLVYRRK